MSISNFLNWEKCRECSNEQAKDGDPGHHEQPGPRKQVQKAGTPQAFSGRDVKGLADPANQIRGDSQQEQHSGYDSR
jgi:hypothetical protein